jgi:hypothetical protein
MLILNGTGVPCTHRVKLQLGLRFHVDLTKRGSNNLCERGHRSKQKAERIMRKINAWAAESSNVAVSHRNPPDYNRQMDTVFSGFLAIVGSSTEVVELKPNRRLGFSHQFMEPLPDNADRIIFPVSQQRPCGR